MPSKPDFVICARNITGKTKKKFGDENAPSSYLFVPDGQQPAPVLNQRRTANVWATRVMAEARRGVSDPSEHGNVLVFIHGFNNDQEIVMRRHRRLRDDLRKLRFKGVVVSFDWPSDDKGVFYLEDMKDAHDSAYQLVEDGLKLLARLQQPDCKVNVHILAHSMGAYVAREAFTWADDADEMAGKTWHVSQTMLIAGDVSARSMRNEDHRSDGMYRCCTRLTCYSSRHDNALKLSNAKRLGLASRAGRNGLPDGAPAHAVNVDCSEYWEKIPDNQKVIGSGDVPTAVEIRRRLG